MKHKIYIIMSWLISYFYIMNTRAQIYPGSYELNAAAVSESGSSETGRCSNVCDFGRVCNAPRSSVLFDGIPILTGLEGDMWASQLLTLNTSTSSASITFNFTNPTNRNKHKFIPGIGVIEVVMFNCRTRRIGASIVRVSTNRYDYFENIAVSESCDYLVRGCSSGLISLSLQPITLSFNNVYSRLYIAEITFYSSYTRQCSSVGPLFYFVVNTTMETSTPSTLTQGDMTTTGNSTDSSTLLRNNMMSGDLNSNVSVIAGIFTFIGGTVFGATVISMGLLIYCMISKKKKSKLNVPASKVRPSSGVAVYEEINAAVSTSSKPIELQDNAAYGKMQSRH